MLVSVARQHAWLCAHQRLAYDTAVTTGAVDLPYDSTPTGTFHIQAITRNQVLTLLSGDQYTVKYWIPFDAPLFGFHDSSWQKMPYGSQKYHTKGSHGCIHCRSPRSSTWPPGRAWARRCVSKPENCRRVACAPTPSGTTLGHRGLCAPRPLWFPPSRRARPAGFLSFALRSRDSPSS